MLIPTYHAGLIDWDIYKRNQARIATNTRTRPHAGGGAVREGTALLHGLGTCDCATYRDLGQAIVSSEFGEDLYHGIHMVRLGMPPLRVRVEDIGPPTEYFGRKFAEKYRIAWSGFIAPARTWLLDHPWPGNVRGLRNLVERSVVLNIKGAIDVADLPPEILSAEPKQHTGLRQEDRWHLPHNEAWPAFERKYLLEVLDRREGNISQAAAAIRIHRQTLQYKLK